VAQAPDSLSQVLDKGYARYAGPTIVRFLTTPAAFGVYQQATAQLATYRPRHPENQERLDSARRYLARLAQQPSE